jgi:hypothetical protein
VLSLYTARKFVRFLISRSLVQNFAAQAVIAENTAA